MDGEGGYRWVLPAGCPRKGWACIDVEDVVDDTEPDEEPEYFTCKACRNPQVRFVHTMAHNDWPDELKVGCVCAGHLEADYAAPKRRETELRKRRGQVKREAKAAERRAEDLALFQDAYQESWRVSRKGNPFQKIGRSHHVVVFKARGGMVWREGTWVSAPRWSFSVNGIFAAGTFGTQEEAKAAGLEVCWRERRARGLRLLNGDPLAGF